MPHFCIVFNVDPSTNYHHCCSIQLIYMVWRYDELSQPELILSPSFFWTAFSYRCYLYIRYYYYSYSFGFSDSDTDLTRQWDIFFLSFSLSSSFSFSLSLSLCIYLQIVVLIFYHLKSYCMLNFNIYYSFHQLADYSLFQATIWLTYLWLKQMSS